MVLMTPALTFDDVYLSLNSHAGPVDILKGVSFVAKAGQAIGIIGPSGSGKTSLLMVASGLEAATKGRVVRRALILVASLRPNLQNSGATTLALFFNLSI